MKKSINKATIASLSTNGETFSAITDQKFEPASNEVNKVSELCIVKWVLIANKYQWCIGY